MHQALILTGPTGSGKSALAMTLAERLGAEIVSMDSMTLYRGMDIGTAKPSLLDRQRVPHHLIDVLDPWESASVAWWLERAQACCRDIAARGKRPLFVGGTPLYLKALLYGLFDGPPADAALRQRLENDALKLGNQALHDRLARIDPSTAARLHPNDQRRIIRALEVWELTGKPISAWQQQWSKGHESAASTERSPGETTRRRPQALWLDRPRAELYDRINRRVLDMLDAGLVEEVQALQQLPTPLGKEALQALGYKEILAYLAGQTTLAEAVTLIQTRTRHFAKRQLTWLRHIPACQPATEELTLRLWTP